MGNIVIDGVINETEWSDGDWKDEFYLNIDDAFNPPDSDGFNYLYLGEDLDNLYIGLDLCSDQTGDETDEWLGVWLNTNNRSFTNTSDWESYFNDGVEALIHDVEKDDVYPFFTNNINSWGGKDFNNNNEFNPVLGNIEGDYTLLDIGAGDYFNITSVPNLGDHQIWIDFSIDVSDWFTYFGELFASAMQEIRFVLRTRVNTTITDQKIILWYNNGTWNKDDPKQIFEINDDIGWLPESFWYEGGNLTVDHKLQFSLYGNHSEPFMTQFDYFEFDIYFNSTNDKGGAMVYPFSSISNYQIEWDFGPSANNASNHRMFEIKIPKNELEHYDPDGDLGIIVGGYGTMSFPYELFWVHSPFNKSIRQYLSANYYYYNMKGCSIPLPTPPILTITTPSPTTSFDIDLTWTSSAGADNYTLYRYISEITSGNLNSATEVKTITGINTFDTVPATGKWYYAVVANNESGSSDPSNSPYIDVVAISPPNAPTLTINTATPTTSFNINLTWTSSAGADNYTLYRHDSLITSGNLTSATEVKTITGTNTLDTVPTTGRWYYAVIANNESGSSDPSNSPYIDVQGTSDLNIPGFPLQYVYLFLLIGISVILYKKKIKK